MTGYETAYLLCEPFLPVLPRRVRGDLKRLLAGRKQPASILDVGGRRSPYTTNLPARVTIIDLPRASEVQHLLGLGVTEQMTAEVRRRRSNVERIDFMDMTQCTFPPESFDAIVSVEVIEHVPEDEKFVANIARTLKPGGFAYLTTPNGDYIKDEPPYYNPDHVRHYTRDQLHALLSRYFDVVEVVYGIKTGKHRFKGLRGFNYRRPARTLVSMISNVISGLESRNLNAQPRRTAHLIAIARKAERTGTQLPRQAGTAAGGG
jgi:2-polyprenyl-3-methyl-5-hydroxy-6-metoxy-1,4-benzoquinol methylase